MIPRRRSESSGVADQRVRSRSEDKDLAPLQQCVLLAGGGGEAHGVYSKATCRGRWMLASQAMQTGDEWASVTGAPRWTTRPGYVSHECGIARGWSSRRNALRDNCRALAEDCDGLSSAEITQDSMVF